MSVISENNSTVSYDHKSLICLNPSLLTLLYATHTAVRVVHTKQHCCGRRIPWSCSLTHTHSQIPIAYPLDIHTHWWLSIHGNMYNARACCLLKAECTFVHVHTNLHLTTRAGHMFIHLSHACANTAAPILHRSISMLPRDHPHPDHHWPIVAETATRLLTFKYQHYGKQIYAFPIPAFFPKHFSIFEV